MYIYYHTQLQLQMDKDFNITPSKLNLIEKKGEVHMKIVAQ